MTTASIPGHTPGAAPPSSLSTGDLALMREAVLLTDDDVAALRMSRGVLAPLVDEILDVWYGFVGSHPQLLDAFQKADGSGPDGDYLAAVRLRFGQWILDTADANYDQGWLNYQAEIGRRHHRSGKNATDGVNATPNIPFRYITLLAYPITATLRPFLARGGHTPEQVDAMQQAWIKSVLLQVTLWAQPYITEGDF